ncbi:hypothetical protein [Micromonospora sp. NPDC047730]|uniref:hypothetical protein n=1 Tax=Micromonospora sp. NPDC047730 TaxID=3364253 RepID=UPI0037116F40
MSAAPANLLAVRRLLLDHLNDAPGPDDLEPIEVGIVGDTAHQRQGDSYHLGTPEQRSYGYSVGESPRDRAGLSVYASALDVGAFRVTTPKGTFDLAHFSRWCVAQCVAEAPDTNDIREIIYSPDGRVVKRWDRLGRRSSGDDSHLWHTHFSFFRDATRSGRDQTPLFRRYLAHIGLIDPPEDDLTPDQNAKLNAIYQALFYGGSSCGATVPAPHRVAGSKSHGNAVVDKLGHITATLAAVAAKDGADEAEIVSGVLAGLSPETIAAAIPTDLAERVAAELARRLAA